MQLARNANPPLEEVGGAPVTTLLEGESGTRGPMPTAASAPSPAVDAEPKGRVDQAVVADGAAPAEVRPEMAGRPGQKPVGHPGSRPARRPGGATSTIKASNAPSAPVGAEKPGGTPPTFDPDNPYR